MTIIKFYAISFYICIKMFYILIYISQEIFRFVRDKRAKKICNSDILIYIHNIHY